MNRDHDIDVLNSLIVTTIDSADGYERSAENADSPRFKEMFREMAGERRATAGRLQQRVRELGGTPDDDGSLAAAAHRRWEDLVKALSGDGDDKAVINEVERGEDYIRDKYRDALRDEKMSPETRTLLDECFESVRKGHDRASRLKHGMEAAGA